MANNIGGIAEAVLAALEGGDPVVTATIIAAPEKAGVPVGSKLLLRADQSSLGSLGGGDFEAAVHRICLEAIPRHAVETVYLLSDGTETRRLDQDAAQAYQVLVEVVEAPATLIVVGAGHIGHSLAKFGAEVGFSVTVLDDRPDYADPQRFPEADKVICADFTETLQSLPISANTYIVMVTRGHKQDELSLRATVQSPARYVGMIGSRRRTGAVLQHLRNEGIAAEYLDRVHTPIGLDIGAETPEEIAISIVAELIMVRRGGSGNPMYYRPGAATAGR